MLTLKLVYKEGDNISQFTESVSGVLEMYNEDNYHEKKNAWSIKNACSARQTPFIAAYVEGKLMKAFYSEANECNIDNILKWLSEFVEANAKKGWISIEKVSGMRNEKYKPGATHRGYTRTFMEGVRCRMETMSNCFMTSIIKKIDWKTHTFETLYSTYKFDFIEDERE